MSEYTEYRQGRFTGERALFASKNLKIYDSVFEDGESPLKESSNIEVENSLFRWKYPFWYCNNMKVTNCSLLDNARAGMWYTKNISFVNTTVEAPKGFRRSKNIVLDNVYFANAAETLWSCDEVKIKNVSAKGDYFAMNSENMVVENFQLSGNYSFDGAKNVIITNSRLLSKDAFWNSENVTVKDSFITGEYFGWNAKNLVLENCTIESLQGLCYIDNLVMKNCKLINTTLAFEYSNVDATIIGKIDSVLNPSSGTIRADKIDNLIIEKDRVDSTKTKIIVNN